jgi:hypothetical protein
LIVLLHDLRLQNAENIGRAFGPALIVRIRKAYAAAGNLAEPLHDLRGVQGQDRIGGVTD